ncbi:hypothetical protein [Methylocapsa sp. S129]|uniref:hypothetical protein n=1 Tax=Methylocapsa sp. S129 TaxID=1641869 RepID=UPI00131EB32D|nr:hypothetical protein [Methylocapsa sp. S129]
MIFVRTCIVGSSALLGACSYLPPDVVPVHASTWPDKIKGLVDLLPNGGGGDQGAMRILFVHGMGVYNACYVDPLLVHLTKALGVQQDRPTSVDTTDPCLQEAAFHFALPTPIPVPADNAQHQARLYHYKFSGAERHVDFWFLVWSPLTDVPKQTLLEPDLPVHHALLTDWVKTFEQDNLADVVLYGGKYRQVLRSAVERAICYFIGGAPEQDATVCDGGQANIPTAIITHSLGAYMVMDALADIYRPASHRKPPESFDASTKAACYLDQIFMLANQLKMLDLTTRTSEIETPRIVQRFHEVMNSPRVQTCRSARGLRSRQIIAISDPNDILSWEVTSKEFDRPNENVANVYLGVTGEYFGLYRLPVLEVAASPSGAHLNYLQSDDTMDIIACGMTGSSINRCAP